MKKRQRGKFPFSGKKRIDNMFRKIICAIEQLEAIYRKDDLIVAPDNPNQLLHGIMTHGHKSVYLTHDPPDTPAAKVLLHEALHKLSKRRINCETNDQIFRREEYYWHNFTKKQQRYLGRYIPRHTVKREPRKQDQKDGTFIII
ncbi:MAG: hypothetical protein HYT37_03780 [Candidatus Sungbacteria bacterium]|nr:hypothetical protein [Candidatus Sungbacteria bacterium]